MQSRSSRLVDEYEYAIDSITVEEFIYYTAFFLYTVFGVFGRTQFEKILFIDANLLYSVIRYICVVLLICKILMQSYTVRSALIALIVFFCMFISWRMSGNNTLAFTCLFIIAGQNVKIRRLAVISLVTTLIASSITVLFSVLGELHVETAWNRGEMVGVRYALGFTHPNSLGGVLVQICVAIVLLQSGKKRLHVVTLIPIIISAAICISVADSRTAAMALLILGVIEVTNEVIIERRSHYIPIICTTLIVLFFVSSILFMIYYNNDISWMQNLNKMLSSRLSLGNLFYKLYPPTLFGRNFANMPIVLSIDGGRSFLVDNSYMKLILMYGTIPFLIVVVGTFMLLTKTIQAKRYYFLLMMITFMYLYAFTESLPISFYFNYTSVALILVLYGDSIEITDEFKF